MPFFATVTQKLADPLLFAIIAGMAAFGHSTGAFVALLSAFQVLVATFAALGLLDWMTTLVSEFGCPEEWCGGVAFLSVFVVIWAVSRVAIGSFVKEDVVRFPPPFDAVGGAVVGAFAGMVLSASLLVAVSMMPVPTAYRLNTAPLRLDFGPRLLAAFASIATADAEARAILLGGEPGYEYLPAEPNDESVPDEGSVDEDTAAEGDDPRPDEEMDEPPPLWGEPFLDVNGSGTWDDGEPFFDTDGDGSYTVRLEENDLNTNGIRDIGLVERYRVGGGRWDRVVVVPPPPENDPATEEEEMDEEAMEEDAEAR